MSSYFIDMLFSQSSKREALFIKGSAFAAIEIDPIPACYSIGLSQVLDSTSQVGKYDSGATLRRS